LLLKKCYFDKWVRALQAEGSLRKTIEEEKRALEAKVG
jgi:hypothetical protein